MSLEHYTLKIVKGGGCPCEWRSRAFVDLPEDLSAAMPHLSSAIKGCAYNPSSHILAFRLDDKRVIVYPKKVVIDPAEDEAEARRLMERIRELVNAAEVA